MLSEAKYLAIFRVPSREEWSEILRSARDDNCTTPLGFWDLSFPGLN
jgi:hypothetical protein